MESPTPSPPEPESPQEEAQPSVKDFVKKYKDNGEFRFALLNILTNGFNNLIALQNEHNTLLREQNELLKEEPKS